MKLYSQKPGASVKMIADAGFTRVMAEIIKTENIQYVFESGTYLGTGSTETFANLFITNNKIPLKFITVETNLDYFKTAKKNLAQYKFIEPVFGLSVDYLEAVKFLVNDTIFNNLEKYADVYIDHVANPQQGYLKEIMVGVFQDNLQKTAGKENKSFFGSTKNSVIEFENNALAEFCNDAPNEGSLFVLDSGAGIGYYEFTQVKHLMQNKNYYIVLDDIHHLKHFRSKEYIQHHPKEFNLISMDVDAGWLIAKALPAES
ncbi:MAG TPA: hypothetical protein VFT78_09675 [Hanamia sp.]|nr:hypothetical protein [Hanamia sp.]